MDDRDVRIAKLTTKVGDLEACIWELRERLARAQRDRGALSGLVRGALKDEALSGAYLDLAERVLSEIDARHASSR